MCLRVSVCFLPHGKESSWKLDECVSQLLYLLVLTNRKKTELGPRWQDGRGWYRGLQGRCMLSTEAFLKHKYYDLQRVRVIAAEMKIHWVSLGKN